MRFGILSTVTIVAALATSTAQGAVIQTGDAVSVVDRDFNSVDIVVGPGDTDIGSDLGFFLNSGSGDGSSLEVNAGSKLAGGRLVTISDSNVPAIVTVTGEGSSIDLTRSGPASTSVIDFASQGSSNLIIRDGGAVTFQTPDGVCGEFECRVGQIGNGAGTSANVTISGSGSLLDLATETAQFIALGQAVVIDDPGFVFGEAGGQTNVNVVVSDGATLETGFAIVANSAEATSNTGTESVNTVVTVTGDGSDWISETIAIGFNGASPTAPQVSGTVIVSNGARISSSDVFVGDGGVLAGNGVVVGNLNNFGGVVAPGLSPGRLTIDGDFVMNSGSLVVEVAGNEPGLFDVLDVSGVIDILGGEIFFDFTDFLPSNEDVFQFLVAGGGTSIADSVTFGFGGVASGFQFSVDRVTGTLISLGNARPVPEPGALGLFAFVVVTLLIRSRRNRFVF